MDVFWDSNPGGPPRESQPRECILSGELLALSPLGEHASAVTRASSLYSVLHRGPVARDEGRAATEPRAFENIAPATANSSSPSTPPPLDIHISGVDTDASSLLSLSASPSRSQRSPSDSSLPSHLVPEVVNYTEGTQHSTDRFGGSACISGFEFANNMENMNPDKPLSSPSANRPIGHAFDSATTNSSSGDESRQHYRHGQIGAFNSFQRFVPGSRPIISDNWRSKLGSDTSTSEASPLGTASNNADTANDLADSSPAAPPVSRTSSHSSPYSHTRTQSRPSVLCTPSRSPLRAPANLDIAGLSHAAVGADPSPTATEGAFTGRGCSVAAAAAQLSVGAAGYSPPDTGSGTSGSNTSPMGQNNDQTNINGNRKEGGNSNNGADGIVEQLSHLSINTNTDTNAGVSAAQTNPLNILADAATITINLRLTRNTLGYCFVRPNGERTRLVPVDMLPVALQGVPASETDATMVERLVELPIPQGVDVDGRSSNTQRLVSAAGGGSNANTPQLQLTANHKPPLSPFPPFSPHVPNSAAAPTSNPPKRMKIYCDKWVHEGVCAFTQQGCKFKHEMPLDTATQHALGLFHGLPAWYKKQQGELARMHATTATTTISSSGGGDGAHQRGVSVSAIGGGGSGQYDRWGVGHGPFVGGSAARAGGGMGVGDAYGNGGGGGNGNRDGGSSGLPQPRQRPQLLQSWRSGLVVKDDEEEEQARLGVRRGMGPGGQGSDGACMARELVPFRFGVGAVRNERALSDGFAPVAAEVGAGRFGSEGAGTGRYGNGIRSVCRSPGPAVWEHPSTRLSQHHAQHQQQASVPGFGTRTFSGFPPSQFGPIAPPRLRQIQHHLNPGANLGNTGVMTPTTQRASEGEEGMRAPGSNRAGGLGN
ncbi:hypothetical protein MMYC01_202963 [Madurella mycetomatis]|uniref:C3H1-type domain-containing protein n=1 Tax=Madurella mycetomatis TaxID=100816 RepID=A0A175WFW3_9PEZI|nr:hypothetical protein MMYC01_202963 [Madurella mycetomatis]